MTKDEAFLEWYKNAHWGNEDLKECCHRSWNAAIKQARSAQAQEPVAIVDEDGVIVVCHYKYKPGDKLYTTPPGGRQSEDCLTAAQRPVAEPHKWVGLTDEEVHALWMTGEANIAEEHHSVVAYEIEAKLKEKNNG